MRYLLPIIILFVSVSAFAQQFDNNYVSLGDRAFKNKDYYEAAYYYKKTADGMRLTSQVELPYQGNMPENKKDNKSVDKDYLSYQLAESYRMYENYIEAEPWYYRVLNDNKEAKYPLARFWYGVCLRANQHFDEALRALKQFKNTYHGDGNYIAMANHEIATCSFAKEQYQYPALVAPVKMKGIWNADGSNYSMVQRDNNYWYTSSRFIKNDKKHLNRVYHTASADKTTKPELIQFKDNGGAGVEYGTPSFSPDGHRMYFTRWYKKGTQTIHGIYFSTWTNNTWSTPQKLNSNVNADGFNSIQPFVTADGRGLYFVSNKPGGQGGDDIWLSELDEQGQPTNSVNLGNSINTQLDEQGPYYDIQKKRLVYSSKGFVGLGGFDFFESTGSNTTNWTKPRNMGYPMNSSKDDLYYYPDKKNNKSYYISSDRQSDCCLDLFTVTDQSFVLKGIVTDCATHEPLDSTHVSYVDSLTKETVKEVTVGKKGIYKFEVNTKRPMELVLSKKGYFTKVVPVNSNNKMAKDTLMNDLLCLQPFKVGKPIVIKNILYDFNKATLRPESKTILNDLVKIMKDNPKMKVELSAHTDSIGSDAYNDKLSQERAQSCVDYIVSTGVSTDRIFARGYGKTRPIAPNSTPDGKDNPEGRQLNRRTEFTVLKTE